MNREKIKTLILLSQDVGEADRIIINEGFDSVREKIAFLKGMFGFSLISKRDGSIIDTESSKEMDYYAILATILNSNATV